MKPLPPCHRITLRLFNLIPIEIFTSLFESQKDFRSFHQRLREKYCHNFSRARLRLSIYWKKLWLNYLELESNRNSCRRIKKDFILGSFGFYFNWNANNFLHFYLFYPSAFPGNFRPILISTTEALAIFHFMK